MKTLLVILSYAKANDIVERHWPFYEKAGCPILGIGREDSECRFPWPVRAGVGCIGVKEIGKDSYVNGDNLPKLLLDTLEYCLREYTTFHSYCLVEPDVIFMRPLPEEHPGGIVTQHMGGSSAGFFGRNYYHCPWWVDRMTAAAIVIRGRKMLECELIECGFPDRFLGLLLDLHPDVRVHPAKWYSRNLFDRPEFIAEARAALKAGAWGCHGIKTADQLFDVTDGLELCGT